MEMRMSENNENKSWLQLGARQITNFFKPSKVEEKKPTDNAEIKKQQFADDLQKISDKGTAIELKTFFLLYFEGLGIIFEGRGKNDGKLEINPRLASDFINSEVKELQGLIKGVFSGKESVAQTNLEARKRVFETAENDLASQKEYVEAIEKKYRFDYKDFAVFIGILYILFSIGFLIADYPLSRLIVVEGFQIDPKKNPTDSWLLTIGITLIGVYFKIWWDEYINPAVEKVVTKNEPKNLQGFEDIPNQEQEDGIKIVRRSRIWRGIIKTSILLISLATIGVLGYFRYIVYVNTELLENGTVSPSLESNWAIVGFVSIAVLFPFLGGICLSIGTDKIQNWRERRKAKKVLEKKNETYLFALKAKEEAEKELDVSKEYLGWCSSLEFIEDCKDLFNSRYNRGYEIGLTESNLETDILTKAENVRKRMLGRNTYENTQPIISESYFRKT